MSDPNYNAVPPGGYRIDPGICEDCGGVMGGFVGFPGEYPCQCLTGWTKAEQDEAARDAMIDAQLEEYQLRKKGAK